MSSLLKIIFSAPDGSCPRTEVCVCCVRCSLRPQRLDDALAHNEGPEDASQQWLSEARLLTRMATGGLKVNWVPWPGPKGREDFPPWCWAVSLPTPYKVSPQVPES